MDSIKSHQNSTIYSGVFYAAFLAISLLFFLPLSAIAQETDQKQDKQQEINTYTYAPETCEFTATFPTEPLIDTICPDDDTKRCRDELRYTQVYELSSTIDVKIICSPIDQTIRDTYRGHVMEKTLRAMTEDSIVTTFDSSFRENDHYKQAGLVGEGRVGKLPTIYIAQLWIGNTSAFSVEAELIGHHNTEAEALFSTFLRSVGYAPEINEMQGTE